MRNYIEHEVLVKYQEGILSQSQDWQWFIDYVEENYDWEDISTYKEYLNRTEYEKLYGNFIRIIEITDNNFLFRNRILEEIWIIAKFYCNKYGLKELKNILIYQYSKILFLNIWLTKLENVDNGFQYIIDRRISSFRNFYELIKTDTLSLQSNEIKNYIKKEIKINDFTSVKKNILDNINKNFYPAKKTFLKKYKNKFLNANAFNHVKLQKPKLITWQEDFILDMLNIRFQNQEIIPLMEFNGKPTPFYHDWTPEVINKIKNYFNNDESILFVLETISYILHKTPISNNVMLIHCQLLTKYLTKCKNTYDIHCSSYEIISYLFKEKKLTQIVKDVSYKNLIKFIHTIKDFDIIEAIKNSHFPISENQKSILKNYYENEYKQLDNISDYPSFDRYIKNTNIAKYINQNYLINSIGLFEQFIQEIDIQTASLFYDYIKFLANIKLSNSAIDKRLINQVIIDIQQLWQNEYYEKVCTKMKSTSYETKTSKEDIIAFNNVVLANPFLFAHTCMPVNIDSINQSMITTAKYVLSSLFKNVEINEFFPIEEQPEKICENHDIDTLLKNIISKIQKEKGYRLLNHLEEEYYLAKLHKDWKLNISFGVARFNLEKELYEKIKKYTNIDLIEYNENIQLAHVTQLFPILEMAIRELALELGILPYSVDDKKFMKYRDPSSILIEILTDIYENLKSFDVGGELLFVYNVMYNSNSLNIRNECIHGREYLKNWQLLFAFKLTLMCIHIIMLRLKLIERNKKTK